MTDETGQGEERQKSGRQAMNSAKRTTGDEYTKWPIGDGRYKAAKKRGTVQSDGQTMNNKKRPTGD